MAITERAAQPVSDLVAEPRAMLLATDDYSAVSRRVPLSNLYERGRALGIGVQVSAQSWQGLGRDRGRAVPVAAPADGGTWILSTCGPNGGRAVE